MLEADTYEQALAIGRAADGRGLSRQAFNLIPKIRDLDAAMTPDRQQWIAEAHPELCFASVARGAVRGVEAHSPRAGRPGSQPSPRSTPTSPTACRSAPGAAVDDVLDAYVLTVTARRLARGDVERLGDGAVDARGLRQEVVL